MSPHRIGSFALALLLAACADKEFTGLKPVLQVKTPAATADKHYLIDFGRVSVGATGAKGMVATNIGRATMVVQPVELAAPFAANQKTNSQVAVQAILQLGFTFTPTEAGVVSQTAELTTNGGVATIDFIGEGVIGPIPDCEFAVEPDHVDFANVLPGASATSGIHFVNKGSVDCDLTEIQLDPTSDAAFTIVSGQPSFATVPPGEGGGYPIGVTFAPPQAGPAFTGKLTFTVGPQGTKVEVPLNGASKEGDCAFTVAPTAINFGNVLSGQTKTSSVTVTQTGPADCEISAVQVDPSSSPAFTLAAGQASSASLNPTSNTFAIRAVFSPTAAGAAFSGKLTFLVGPQNTTFEVPLSASSSQSACGYRVTPSSLAFGAVVAGHPKTLTATVSRTGSTTCAISGLQIDPASNAAYTLASGQATSGSLPNALSSFPIKVTFNPPAVGTSFTGKATFQIGPPGATVNVLLSGSSPPLCSNPNPDGTCPAATGSVYLNTSTDLYRFDPTTHQAVRVGAFNGSGGSFSMYDIAINTQGQMVGVSSGSLYVIDPLTALCTQVGTVSSSANGLTYLPDGRLVIAGDSTVEILDPVTYASVRTLVSSGYTSSGDIIALPDGMLYWTVQGGDVLIRINPANGATTRIGNIGYSTVYGLGYANGTLFGFNNGHYLIINQSTGAATAGNVAGDWYGATTNPSVW